MVRARPTGLFGRALSPTEIDSYCIYSPFSTTMHCVNKTAISWDIADTFFIYTLYPESRSFARMWYYDFRMSVNRKLFL